MDARARQKQRTREAIVASAAALLRKQGIRASSVSDVMQGAGLTVGGFYAHFTSKEDLFAETIRSAGSVLWNQMLGAVKGLPPAEQVKGFIGRYLSRTHRDHPESGCLLPASANEVAAGGEPYRKALEHELSGFVRSLGSLLEGANRKETALALMALAYGALSLSRAVAGTPLSDDFLKAGRAAAERLANQGLVKS
jgi:TetR/AcrR family transcriptional repressor of nem operon